MKTLDDVLIETDARGRTNLGKFGKNSRFRGRQEADGTIILEPVKLVTPAEERLARNEHVVERVRKIIAAGTENDVEVQID
jgi:hypothetical protein